MYVKNLIIFGTGGHAGVIVDIINSNRPLLYGIKGFVKSECNRQEIGTKYRNYPILGTLEDIKHLNRLEFVIAIGDNYVREKIYNEILQTIPTAKFPAIIHPTAIVSCRAEINEGTVISAGAIINTNSQIGKFCIVNTGSIVEHDCMLDDFSNLATGVKLGGSSQIGRGSFIGIGATIIHKIIIGENNVIGAGSVVVKSFPNNLLVIYGLPAKVITSRNQDDKYL